MIEPLILKSQSSNIVEGGKGKILTAAELMNKFAEKTQSKIYFPNTSSINNLSSSSSNPQLVKIALSNKQIFNIAPCKNISKQFQIFNAAETLPFIADKHLSTQFIKKNSFRQKIVKSVNQLNKKIKSSKQFNIEVHKLVSNKENICLTERGKTPMSTKNRSFAFKMNINLQNKGSLTSRNINDQNYFRKASDASTLSLKTKHTTSMQQLEDDNDSLFSRPQLSSVLQNSKQPNILVRLEEAKKKLYQQIYSLDKKLLNNNFEEKIVEPPKQYKEKIQKKTIVISLKKKQLKNNESSNNIGI